MIAEPTPDQAELPGPETAATVLMQSFGRAAGQAWLQATWRELDRQQWCAESREAKAREPFVPPPLADETPDAYEIFRGFCCYPRWRGRWYLVDYPARVRSMYRQHHWAARAALHDANYTVAQIAAATGGQL